MVKDSPDFGTYVAIGDSITSGYTDGALYQMGQLTCYPNLLATQFKLAGGGNFNQALLEENSVGIGFFGNSRLIAKKERGSNGFENLTLSYLAPQGDINALHSNFYSAKGPFNNMGVPGLKSTTAVTSGYGNPANGEGNYNPFFSRIASDPAHASVLSDALALNARFFSLFIGNNDVLAYALSGGTTDTITTPEIFEACIRKIICELISIGSKGVIAGIPDISAVPYFNTIPPDNLHLDTETGNRPIATGEFILLDILFDSQKELFLREHKPIPKKYVLTIDEIATIKTTVDLYNKLLRSVALENKLAFVDTGALIQKVKKDRVFNPEMLQLSYKKSRIFSLDGVHLTPLGQALLANEFIKEINKTYRSGIPKIALVKYRRIPYLD